MRGETGRVKMSYVTLPAFIGVGYAICIIDFYMGMYYNTIIGWAVYYFVASFTSELPWTSCDHPWNTNSCALVGPVDNGTFVRSPAQEYFEYILLLHPHPQRVKCSHCPI